MKKRNPIFFLRAALILLSAACYLHLSHSAATRPDFDGNSLAVSEDVETGNKEEPPAIVFPDIALIKKIINLTKIVLEHP